VRERGRRTKKTVSHLGDLQYEAFPDKLNSLTSVGLDKDGIKHFAGVVVSPLTLRVEEHSSLPPCGECDAGPCDIGEALAEKADITFSCELDVAKAPCKRQQNK
jgi:hypothetical protein